MVDFNALMGILSVPRHNGSPGERAARQALLDWMDAKGIPHHIHTFRLYPHFFIFIGLWLILSRTLLAAAIWLRWGWPSAVIALVGLAGGLVDIITGFPLVSWPGAVVGKNIILEFGPAEPEQEIVISAHYDSKTELLDHHQRLFFVRKLPLGIVLTVLLGILGPLDSALNGAGSGWAPVTYGLGFLLCLVLLFLAWGLGLSLSMGRFRKPSQGAVDNGAACAILLGFADQLMEGHVNLQKTRLTLALFTGEEVNMQGSRAYAVDRDWDLPSLALNLEVMAQDGDYVYWEQDGTSLKLVPTSPQVNQAVVRAVHYATGAPAKPAGPLNSDGYSFLRNGIAATTMGTYDRGLVDRGFHGPEDNLDRVVMERLPEGVDILAHFVRQFDLADINFPGNTIV